MSRVITRKIPKLRVLLHDSCDARYTITTYKEYGIRAIAHNPPLLQRHVSFKRNFYQEPDFVFK